MGLLLITYLLVFGVLVLYFRGVRWLLRLCDSY